MVTPIAFHALIVTIRLISAPSSGSENCSAAAAKSASGTCVCGISVTDSASAKRGPFPVVKEWRLPPGRQGVDPLLGLAGRPRVLGVHVDAERAAVELGRADAHQLAQPDVDPGVVEFLGRRLVEMSHRAVEAGGVLLEVDPGLDAVVIGFLLVACVCLHARSREDQV